MSTSKHGKRQEEYLRTLYVPDVQGELAQHLIDIVFVHGLNPHSNADFANATWTHENGNFWPTKQLPKRVPSARILVFSYNSQVAWDTSKNGIQKHANNLLDRLSGARESRLADKNYSVPIIFVAHSLGGLVVKQALVTAKIDDTYINLRKATYGLVFFAVPHQGGHGAGLGAIAKNIVLSLTGDANNDLIESLKSNSLFQESQTAFFKHQLEDYQIVSVCEDKPTKLTRFLGKATALLVVDERSATLGLPGTRERLLTVDSNHSEVCKFEDDDNKFEPIKRAIGTLADRAIAKQKKTATDKSCDGLHAQEYIQKFLHSLHFPAIQSRQEEIADAHKETFQWIFDDSGDAVRPWANFVEWLETGRGIYWISGKAGSGKSTLMSYICEHPRTMRSLKTWAGPKVSMVATPKFFFWSPGSPMQKTSVGLLRSLLYQIFQEYPESVPPPTRNEPLSDWTEKRLRKIFQNLTRDISSSYRICFFIDGLDEFSGDHDALIEMFQELVQDEKIKVVLSSRPYPTFDRAFGSRAMLKLQDLTRADIKKFVLDKFFAHPRIQSMAAQEPQNAFEHDVYGLINDVVWKSDGVFLWVDLAVKDLIRGINDEDSLEQLKERLDFLPTRLEDLYAQMLSKIDKVHREEAAWFLQIALHQQSDECSHRSSDLLDFTLAVYKCLDRDLESSADFPSQNVMDHCQWTRRRIATTCAGLLEVHQRTFGRSTAQSFPENTNSEDTDPEGANPEDTDPEDTDPEDTDLEDTDSEDTDSEDTNPEDTIPEVQFVVSFLHRTVADFLNESEQGRKFLGANTSPNRNIYVVWAKVLVAKVRMLGFTQDTYLIEALTIEDIMTAASDAEYKTGVAQTAICAYIELAVTILDQKRGVPVPGSHWCTRINKWASRGSHRVYLERSLSYQFRYTSNQAKEDGSSRPASDRPVDHFGFAMSDRPIDYLGFAVSNGLKLYMQQQITLLPAGFQSSTATYLLRCTIISSRFDDIGPSRTSRFLDLVCALLRHGANPNVPECESTVWGHFLARMVFAKDDRRWMDHELAHAMERPWRTAFNCFIEHGADTNGILSMQRWNYLKFEIEERDLHRLPNGSSRFGNMLGICCYLQLRISVSVPTLIRYYLGDSPDSADIVSACMLNGAFYHAKCTEISIRFEDGEDLPPLKQWALSDQQSDRLLEAFERYVIPTVPPRSSEAELKRLVLCLYDEISMKEPVRIQGSKSFRSLMLTQRMSSTP